jgi:hypothetical protein
MSNHDELLAKTYKLALDNNKMLRRMKRAAFWGMVFKIVFWALMLGIPVYLYFIFLQPVLEEFSRTADQFRQTGEQFQQIGAGANLQFARFQDFFNFFPGLGGE